MPNRLPEHVYAALLEALPSDRPISREDFRRYDVPEAISHFLQHALDRRLELETARIMDLARGWVDHDREEITLARSAYLRLLGRYAHYPTSEWPRALRQAVQLVSAYLIRPVPTLIHFVFGEKRSELAAADVGRRMDYFIGFKHLRTAVDAFVERSPDHPVGRRALAEALEAVDRQICHEYTLEDWRTLVAPLADLGHLTPTRALSLDILARFFEARGGNSISAGIMGYARARNLGGLERDQLDSALVLIGAPKEYKGIEPGAGHLSLFGESEVRDESLSSPKTVSPPQEAPAEPESVDPAAVVSISEPAVSIESEPTATIVPEPVAVIEPEPVAPIEPEPAAPIEPEPAAHIEPEPAAPAEPEPAAPTEPEPDPAAPAEPEPAAPLYLAVSDEPQGEDEPLWRRFRSDAEQSPEQPAANSTADEDSDEPLWKKFQNSLDIQTEDQADDPPPTARTIRLHPSPEPEPKPEPEPVVDRATLEFAVLGPAAWQRDAFIERVFNDSTELYFEALEKLNACREWRAASDFIAIDIFRANRVNIYDEAAIDFTNAVEAQFKRR